MKFARLGFVVGCCAAAMGLFVVSPGQAALIHRYSFTTDASDSVGTANGTLTNGATVSGGQLQLANGVFGNVSSATGKYLALPPTILPSSGSATIEQWFTFQGSGFFTEAYTFSNSANDTNPPGATTGQYLMHTISAPQPPPGGTGGSHIAQALTGYQAGSETDAFETTPGLGAGGGGYLDDGETFMAATVIDGGAGTLSYYLNGILQSTIPANPLSSYSFTNAYLGRSAFPGDNVTTGTVDEFRIYNNAQSPIAITADFAAGPNTVAVPEPMTLSVVSLGVFGLLMRRPSRFARNS